MHCNHKKNNQCRNTSKYGSCFCDVHQKDTYCTGITLKNEPCCAQRTDGTLFCIRHQSQGQSQTSTVPTESSSLGANVSLEKASVFEDSDIPDFKTARCIAITKKNNQCKNSTIYGSSFCDVHQKDTYCTGVTLKNEPCRLQRVSGTQFCNKHQGQASAIATDCCLFRGKNLLDSKRTSVLEYRNARDCYTGEAYDDIRVPNLDHIVELHLLRDCYDLVSGTTETKKPLFSIVRSTANEIQNLNFTSEVLNQAKHCAVKSFCEDFGSKKCHSDGIRYYFSRKGFDEDVCSRMMEQIHISMDFMTPILNEHEEMVGNMYSMMDRMML